MPGIKPGMALIIIARSESDEAIQRKKVGLLR
jgi:hypothetical protein